MCFLWIKEYTHNIKTTWHVVLPRQKHLNGGEGWEVKTAEVEDFKMLISDQLHSRKDTSLMLEATGKETTALFVCAVMYEFMPSHQPQVNSFQDASSSYIWFMRLCTNVVVTNSPYLNPTEHPCITLEVQSKQAPSCINRTQRKHHHHSVARHKQARPVWWDWDQFEHYSGHSWAVLAVWQGALSCHQGAAAMKGYIWAQSHLQFVPFPLVVRCHLV